MDYITIDDLRINAAHGHYERERQVEQEFLIFLRVGVDATSAPESDMLSDTIDYDHLREIVENIYLPHGGRTFPQINF